MTPSLFDNNKEYHAIKIEHPLLNYYGLTAVTTGQLIAWWNQQNYQKEFVNRNFFIPNPFGEDTFNVSTVGEFLKIKFPEDKNQNYRFKAWRKQGYNGKYESYYAPNLNSWSLYEDILNETEDATTTRTEKYTYTDLSWGESCQGADEIDDIFLDVEYPTGSGQFPKWFYQFINSYSTVVSAYSNFGSDTKTWPTCLQARKALADDIMIGGGLVWSGVLGFNVNLGNIVCQKEELVKFTLQFFEPTELKKRNDNFVAMKKLFLSAPATDPFGRKIASSQDGGHRLVTNESDISQHKAGELSVTYNPVDKKWESGTTQIPAILATDIAASNARTSEQLESTIIEDLLNNPTSTSYINMPTGLAIPFVSTNGNPSTIVPTYKEEDGCRSSTEKFKVIVYNPFPKALAKDSHVMLSKINGVWIPLEVGIGSLPKKKLAQDGRWSFAYFMTNPNFFFIKKNGERFTYTDYEQAFRSRFYDSPDIEQDNKPYQQEPIITQEDLIPEKWKEIKYAQDEAIDFAGHIQVTSFDFMHSSLGGKNDYNRIGNTHTYFDTRTSPYEKGGTDARIYATQTAPFFGCVFPDGYSDDKVVKYSSLQSANHNGAEIIENLNHYDGIIDQFYSYADRFLTEIKNTDIIFNNSRNRNKNSFGMFTTQGSNGPLKDSTVSHLPADIALLASPSGKYGSPLSVYTDSFLYMNTVDDAIIVNCFDRVWLSDGTGINNENSSFYDFKPVKKNRIQFRPLKAETFAFDELTDEQFSTYKNNLNKQYIRQNKGIFSAISRLTQTDGLQISKGQGNNDDNIYDRHDTIYDSMDIDPIGTLGYNPNFTGENPPTHNPVYNGNNTKYNWLVWEMADWMLKNKGWSNGCGGGAIGQIGAQYTVSAETAISFDVESLLGQPAKLENVVISPNIQEPGIFPIGGGLIIGGGGGGGWTDRRFHQTWGPCNNYYDLNTTGLFARIFEAWPREQTYFDPRYFAVIHFNPLGPLDKLVQYSEPEWYFNGSKRTDEPPNGTEYAYPEGWYRVEKTLTKVDFRIPTFRNALSDGLGNLAASQGLTIVKNTLRDYKDWRIDPSRRRKILPFKKHFWCVGIGNSTDELTTLIVNNLQTNQNPKFQEYDCAIYNQGENYTADDLFTVADGKDVVLKPIVQNGLITGFIPLSNGMLTTDSYFAGPDDKVKNENGELNSPENLLKITPSKINAGGTGLSAYICKGRINKYLVQDRKPVEIPDGPFKLTPNPIEASLQEVTYELSRITEVKVQKTADDGTAAPYSETNQYDVFFHFHNDISHTLTDSQYFDSTWEAWENAVTVTINAV